MNSALASKDRSQAKPFFKYLKLCLGGLHKCPLVSGTYTRGIKSPNLQNYKPGRAPFFWWAFTSTTDSVQYTSEFLGTGSRMLFMVQGVGVDVRRFSAFPTEGEVLMLPGTLLKLKGVLSQPGNLHIAQLVQQPCPPMIDFTHPQLSAAIGAMQAAQ